MFKHWYMRHFHLFQRWYWLAKIGAIPLVDYRKLQDSYMRLCAEQWNSTRPTYDSITQSHDHIWNSPEIVIATDYKRGIPCS